jgi:hypothetical protein
MDFLRNVLLLVLCIMIPAVISARCVRNQNKVTDLPGKQSSKRPRITRQSIGRNETASLRLRRPKTQTKQKHLSKQLLNRISECGANVTKCPGEGLYMIDNMRFGDKAWKIFEDFADSAPNTPLITILFGPPLEVRYTPMTPSDSLIPDIVIEASSIRSHYAKLDISAFAGGVVPAIPKPGRFPAVELFNTTKLALSKLCERIQNPNHPEYPVLAALPPGSYICTVTYFWTNAALLVEVHKPPCEVE